MTSRVIQAVSPELATSPLRICDLIRPRPPMSLISQANRAAVRTCPVAWVSAAPPASATMPQIRSGR